MVNPENDLAGEPALDRGSASDPDGTFPEDCEIYTAEERACVARLDRVAELLDRSIKLPFDMRVGLDGLLGLVPGVGDITTFAVSGWIINEARRLDVPRLTLWRMFWNVSIDTLIGAIPLVGDLFDFFNKANVKNIAILKKSLEKRKAKRMRKKQKILGG